MTGKLTITIDKNTSGGAERVAVVLANYFANNGYHVNIINADRDSCFYPVDSKVTVIKMGLDYSKSGVVHSAIRCIKKWLFLMEYFRKLRNNTVLTFLPNMEIPTIIAAKLYKIPVYTSVLSDPRTYSLPIRCFRMIAYPRISGIIFQTEKVKSFKDFKNVRKAAVIANPLMQKISERQVPVSATKRKRLIFTVGRLEKCKNHEGLIKAFTRLAIDYPDVKLFIYGEGPLHDSLQDLIMKLHMGDRIFLQGVETDAVYHNRDSLMFVLNSHYEGMPNALMEALAYGIPAISTDFFSGAAREMIRDVKNGFLVPVDNDNALEKKMRYLLDNPGIANDITSEATRIYDSCNTEKICTKWKEFMYG